MSFSTLLHSLTATADAFTIDVTPDWGQGRATQGGLMAAVGNEAMRRLVPADRPLRSLQTTFVGPAAAGQWQIRPQVLRVGRAVTLARCDIMAEGTVAATLMGVYGSARESAVAVALDVQPATRSVDECRELQFDANKMPAFMQHFAVRWAEGSRPFSGAAYGPTRAYMRHRDPAVLTESHAVALADCTPTAALAMFKAPAQASSLVWTLEFIEHEFAFSADAWWRIDTHIDAAGDGYVHQTGILQAPDGRPIALTRQVYAIFG